MSDESKIVAFLLAFALSIVGMLWATYAAWCLWYWLAMPLFNAREITFWQCFAILLLCSVFFKAQSPNYKDHEMDVVKAVTGAFIRPALLLIAGYIAKGLIA